MIRSFIVCSIFAVICDVQRQLQLFQLSLDTVKKLHRLSINDLHSRAKDDADYHNSVVNEVFPGISYEELPKLTAMHTRLEEKDVDVSLVNLYVMF